MMWFLKMLKMFSISWLGRTVFWPSWTSTLKNTTVRRVRGGREGGQYLFYFAAVFPPSPFFRNAPWVLFVNHPATDTSLCLHLFTASGNVAPRLFWRGLAASYLTDLPMKNQTHSMDPQCYT